MSAVAFVPGHDLRELGVPSATRSKFCRATTALGRRETTWDGMLQRAAYMACRRAALRVDDPQPADVARYWCDALALVIPRHLPWPGDLASIRQALDAVFPNEGPFVEFSAMIESLARCAWEAARGVTT